MIADLTANQTKMIQEAVKAAMQSAMQWTMTHAGGAEGKAKIDAMKLEVKAHQTLSEQAKLETLRAVAESMAAKADRDKAVQNSEKMRAELEAGIAAAGRVKQACEEADRLKLEAAQTRAELLEAQMVGQAEALRVALADVEAWKTLAKNESEALAEMERQFSTPMAEDEEGGEDGPRLKRIRGRDEFEEDEDAIDGAAECVSAMLEKIYDATKLGGILTEEMQRHIHNEGLSVMEKYKVRQKGPTLGESNGKVRKGDSPSSVVQVPGRAEGSI